MTFHAYWQKGTGTPQVESRPCLRPHPTQSLHFLKKMYQGGFYDR